MLRRPQLLFPLAYQPPWAVLLDQPESAERELISTYGRRFGLRVTLAAPAPGGTLMARDLRLVHRLARVPKDRCYDVPYAMKARLLHRAEAVAASLDSHAEPPATDPTADDGCLVTVNIRDGRIRWRD